MLDEMLGKECEVAKLIYDPVIWHDFNLLGFLCDSLLH